MTDVYTLAQVAADALNRAEILPGVTSYVDPMPEFELSEIDALSAVFMPVNVSLEDASRQETRELVTVELMLLARVSGKEDLADLVAQVQKLMAWFRHRDFPDEERNLVYHCSDAITEALFDADMVRTENRFYSFLELEFEVYYD